MATAGMLSRLRIAIAIGCPVILLGLLAAHWTSIDAGSDAVSHADGEWLMLATVATLGTWLAAACSQLGAVTVRVPVGRVVAAQLAGSFTNHVLPAGVGAAGVNLRMLRRAGLGPLDAGAAIAVNAAAGVVVHGSALAVVLIAFAPAGRVTLLERLGMLALLLGLLGALVLWLRRGPAEPPAGRGPVRAGLDRARVVLRQPRRALLLWGGSIALPALHVLILIAVLHSLSLPAPVLSTALAYLAASAVAALVPSPGGFGSLDAALVLSLTVLGAPAGSAVAAVVGYRLLTVWLPLAPGAATLLVLLRRRIV